VNHHAQLIGWNGAHNRDPPDLCLHSWDYRPEPLCPANHGSLSILGYNPVKIWWK
jgi:hypothetical protein